jgi:hypothetical protein
MQLQHVAEELRARDTLRGAVNRNVAAREMTEADAWDSLEGVNRGYSELEYRFQRLMRNEDTLQLWREARRGDS